VTAEPPRVSARTAIWLRLIVSPLLLVLVVGVLVLHDSTGNPLSTDVLLLLLGAGAGYEMARLLPGGVDAVRLGLVVVACGLLGGIGLLAPERADVRADLRGWIVAAAFVAALARHLFDTRQEALAAIASVALPVVYVGLLLSWSRELGAGPEGARTLLWVTLVAKASDIGGWLVGKPFGRHKLVPTVSPGKTWEGVYGGMALSLLVAGFGASVLSIGPASWSLLHRLLFGAAVGAASILAGITHSGWKRRVGVKDSSRLIPEIGGVLDMVDSMLFAGPVAVLWFHLVP
jgi:phosphatidate cytidylyltransferase